MNTPTDQIETEKLPRQDFNAIVSQNNLCDVSFWWGGIFQNKHWSARVEYSRDGVEIKKRFQNIDFVALVLEVQAFIKSNS